MLVEMLSKNENFMILLTSKRSIIETFGRLRHIYVKQIKEKI